MVNIAFMFSGQGAQHPGMGKEFYETSPTVHALYDEAEALRPGTLEMMFNGTPEDLKKTENTQPCLYLADIAPALVLHEAGITPEAVAGFSLGEIPALAFAGVFSLIDGFKITCDRGICLGRAAEKVEASMVAVMKLEDEKIEELCRGFNQVYPVNYNCPGQLVVSGSASELPAFCEAVSSAGGRCIPLKVGGAFHSPFMDSAAGDFAECLMKYSFSSPKIPVYSNLTAKPYGNDIADYMRRQVNNPVRWTSLQKNMASAGINTFIETGVGDVLKKLTARTLPGSTAFTAETPAQLQEVVSYVRGGAND